MREFIYRQIVNHILRNYSFPDSLAGERRLVFFAEKKDDDVYKWAYEHRELLFLPLYEEIQLALKGIMSKYPRIISARKNRSGADPWVIALAQVENRDVVTNEGESNNLDKPHIPDVCRELDIRCITMHQLIREQGWRF